VTCSDKNLPLSICLRSDFIHGEGEGEGERDFIEMSENFATRRLGISEMKFRWFGKLGDENLEEL